MHVWRVPLRLPDAELRGAERLLDAAERERAARFRFEEHRHAFVAGRGIQRDILARYTGLDPAEVTYRLGVHGKPALSGRGAAGDIRFNFSSSAGIGLLALAIGREVGADVEVLRPVPDSSDVAARFFSPSEAEVLRGVPHEERDLAFLRCWTRKEAYVKAVGGGLSIELGSFDVAFAPGDEARILCHRHDAAEARRWTMRALEAGDGYVAALVVEGDGWTLRRFDWPSGEVVGESWKG